MLNRFAFAAAAGVSSIALAGNVVDVTNGQTSVLLDTDTLAAVASLELSGVAGPVIAPGSIEGSVAFGINNRDAEAPLLPTTFFYD